MEKEIKKTETSEQEEGATMVEYALLVALIAVVCIAAVTFLGSQTSQAFSRIGSAVSTT